MNKGTTDSYFPFFGVPYHLILRGKISGLGNEALEIWLSGGVIFLVSSEIREVYDGKTEWENKNDIAHSMAYL